MFQNLPHMQKNLKISRQSLKRLLNCPRYVPPAIVRLFAGIEPIAARLDLLKLRYFWRLSKTEKRTTSKILYDIKRKNFLSSGKGFLHEVFNLCCKYTAIDIWHGISRPKVNPMRWIKKLVLDFNLSKDLSVGKKETECSFSALFLTNPLVYRNKYQILEPFRVVGRFRSTDARKSFFKALLYNSPYLRPCIFCNESFKDQLHHKFSLAMDRVRSVPFS